MDAAESKILVLNAGSSSIKCSVYRKTDTTKPLMIATVQGIGLGDVFLRIQTLDGSAPQRIALPSETTHDSALASLMNALQTYRDSLSAIGYRVVHGGAIYTEPTLLTKSIVQDIAGLAYLAPEHIPLQTAIMRTLLESFPTAAHVACFDTAFHHRMPRVAQLTTLPRSLESLGLRRYGFHGLSYEYLLKKLAEYADKERPPKKVIFAHLGNGASLAAVHNGNPIDTSMGMTPASGVMMSTRTGDIDPGVITFLATQHATTFATFNTLVNEQSGLLGVSGSSGDMRKLLAIEATDRAAAEAVELFCYTVKKYIGAYSAVLGGIDALVFSGGIGEQAPVVRARICESLAFLGITLDPEKNATNEILISPPTNSVPVFVIPTDEEQMIAEHVTNLMSNHA